MSSNDTYTEAEWFWLSNLNPDGSDEEPEWTSYSQEESKLIEKAYLRQKSHVYLKYYCIDFELNEQRRINNPSRRRPVKRVEHDKGMFFNSFLIPKNIKIILTNRNYSAYSNSINSQTLEEILNLFCKCILPIFSRKLDQTNKKVGCW